MSSYNFINLNITEMETRFLLEGIDKLRQSKTDLTSSERFTLEDLTGKLAAQLTKPPKIKRPLKFSKKIEIDTPLVVTNDYELLLDQLLNNESSSDKEMIEFLTSETGFKRDTLRNIISLHRTKFLTVSDYSLWTVPEFKEFINKEIQ